VPSGGQTGEPKSRSTVPGPGKGPERSRA